MINAIRYSSRFSNLGILSSLRGCASKEIKGNKLFSTFQSASLKHNLKLPATSFLTLKSNVKAVQVAHLSTASEDNFAAQLREFLDTEISEESKQNTQTIPSKIDDFEVKLDGADVSLVKKEGDETITIDFSVNDSTEMKGDTDAGSIVASPRFDVSIARGQTTLGFSCSFVDRMNDESADLGQEEGEYEDSFQIDLITVYEGEYSEKAYSANGNLIDGNMYNLLMELLATKGVHEGFVQKLSELATSYEQSLYVSFLRGIKKFV